MVGRLGVAISIVEPRPEDPQRGADAKAEHGVPECGHDGQQIDREPQQVGTPDPLQHLVRYAGADQPVIPGGSEPEEVVGHVDGHVGGAVERRRRVGPRTVQVGREQRRRERHESDQQQQQAIGIEKPAVHPLQEIEEAVVVDPHGENGPERPRERQERRPERPKRRPEFGVARLGRQVGDPDFQDQQGNGNCEDPVAERLDPRGIPGHDPLAARSSTSVTGPSLWISTCIIGAELAGLHPPARGPGAGRRSARTAGSPPRDGPHR